MEIDRNGLEVLERAACLQLLSSATLGRVALSCGAIPTILPVNYWFDGARILILTSDGSKLDAAIRSSVVAFEVDDFDALQRSGWSVVVVGMSSMVTDPDELAELADAPLTRWAPHGNRHVVAISADMVSGRRMRMHPAPSRPMTTTR
jgi:uncharacterized protein